MQASKKDQDIAEADLVSSPDVATDEIHDDEEMVPARMPDIEYLNELRPPVPPIELLDDTGKNEPQLYNAENHDFEESSIDHVHESDDDLKKKIRLSKPKGYVSSALRKKGVATKLIKSGPVDRSIDLSQSIVVDEVEFKEDNIENLRTVSIPRAENGFTSKGVIGSVGFTSSHATSLGAMREPANNNDDDAISNAENGVNNQNLHMIPEAFLVEDEDKENDQVGDEFVVAGHAEVIPPWWKQTPAKIFCAILCVTVTASAIGIGLLLASSNDTKSDDWLSQGIPSAEVTGVMNTPNITDPTQPSPLVIPGPTYQTRTEPPSAGPSRSPTQSCVDNILSTSQAIALPLGNPPVSNIDVDGRNMVVLAIQDDLYLRAMFYKQRDNGMWEYDTVIPVDRASGQYSVALSGKTAFLQFADGIVVFQQDDQGNWAEIMRLAGDFNSVDVDESQNLACASSGEHVHVYRRDLGGNWVEKDSISSYPVLQCRIAGDTVVFVTEKTNPSGIHLPIPDYKMNLGNLELAIHKYNRVLGQLEPDPLQLPIGDFAKILSIDLTENRLAFSVQSHFPGGRKVFIYDRQDSSQPFTLLQSFSSSLYYEMSLENDLFAVSGRGQTSIFSEGSDGTWHEALILDPVLWNVKVSGRTLLGTTERTIHSYNLDHCIPSAEST